MLNVIVAEEPNVETITAIEEVQNIKKISTLAKTYDNVDLMMN